MREYKHDNIVQLVGIACQREPLFIVLEFCKRGSLLKVPRLASYMRCPRQANLVSSQGEG